MWTAEERGRGMGRGGGGGGVEERGCVCGPGSGAEGVQSCSIVYTLLFVNQYVHFDERIYTGDRFCNLHS